MHGPAPCRCDCLRLRVLALFRQCLEHAPDHVLAIDDDPAVRVPDQIDHGRPVQEACNLQAAARLVATDCGTGAPVEFTILWPGVIAERTQAPFDRDPVAD